MSIFRHDCGETNHRFEARYDTNIPWEQLAGAKIKGADLNEFRNKTYKGDVCIYCGKIVHEQKK